MTPQVDRFVASTPLSPLDKHRVFHAVMANRVIPVHSAEFRDIGLPDEWPADLQAYSYWEWRELT